MDKRIVSQRRADPELAPPPREAAAGIWRCREAPSARRATRRIRAAAWGAVALAAAMGLPAAVASDGGAGDEWTTPAGTVQGTRYSLLKQITSANAASLVEEFAAPTNATASHQGQPLVIGSTMYVVAPFPNKLIAFNLDAPGSVRWTYDPKADIYARGVACCDTVNRGAAYGDGKIVYNVLDGTTVAVDATTGKEVWRTKLGEPTKGETMTMAPLIVNGKVIVGNSGAELGVRGWVQALNLKNGKPVWKAYNTGPDADVKIGPRFHAFYAKDRGTDLGATSWPGDLWKQGGSTTWGWLTYDPSLNLFYHGTANPGVWNPDMRRGDNKWGASVIARDPDTGEAVWAYQITPHDGWDFDAISENIVADLKIDGVKRRVLVHVDKNGFGYTLDAATGEVLKAEKVGFAVTWAEKVNMKTGVPVVNPGMRPHQGVITENICPSPLGVKEISPSAFSPATGLQYVPAINTCVNFEPLKALYIAGTPFMGADIDFVASPGGFLGELVAWNAATGQRAWSIQEPLPLYSGVLATAGNLVFYGTLDKWFRAVDATTGQVVFQTQLECGITGSPMSYTGPDGKQRVAVYSGVGYLAGGFAGGPCPAQTDIKRGPSPLAAAVAGLKLNMGQRSSATSGMVHVFKLP
jgi:PQQ-dependent dehydrogenase (methanol/ethanol family)